MGFDFKSKISWDSSQFLREIIREEFGNAPQYGLANKRNQVIDYLSGYDLTQQLKFLGEDVKNEKNAHKRGWLKQVVNDIKVESEDYNSDSVKSGNLDAASVKDDVLGKMSDLDDNSIVGRFVLAEKKRTS